MLFQNTMAIDEKIYKKIDKLKVRKFNIPDDKKIIIFNSFSEYIIKKRLGSFY